MNKTIPLFCKFLNPYTYVIQYICYILKRTENGFCLYLHVVYYLCSKVSLTLLYGSRNIKKTLSENVFCFTLPFLIPLSHLFLAPDDLALLDTFKNCCLMQKKVAGRQDAQKDENRLSSGTLLQLHSNCSTRHSLFPNLYFSTW